MLSIPVKEFLFWKKKQLSKGGDQQSFAFLLDCIGGLTTLDLYSQSINPTGNLYLKNVSKTEFQWLEPNLENQVLTTMGPP